MMKQFAGTLGMLLITLALQATATTWRVGPAERIQRITDALELCADGDTVLVLPGTYREGVITIDRAVALLGKGGPVIDGGGAGDVLVVKASGVVIDGFTIRGTAISDMNDNGAIKCISVSDITIRRNLIEHAFFGIYLSSVKSARLKHNRVIGDASTPENRRANGIHMWKCAEIVVAGNTVEHHRDGIYLEFVTDSRIDRNTSRYHTRYGLHFMFSHRDTYTNNLFHDNGAGVAVMFTHDVRMTGNRFDRNRGASAYGLLLKEINNAYIEGNLFTDNSTGILMDGCNRAQVLGNMFRANGWAVRLFANSTGAIFSGNLFSGNTFDVTTNGDLVLSTLKGNYWDRYSGYDLDRNGHGDVPYRPFGLFALVVERMPYAMVLSRSLLVQLLDQVERLLPSLSPEALQDREPLMHPPHG